MDGVLDCEEPEFGRQELFGHVVACDIANVLPIAFAQAVLALSSAWGAGDLGVGFKEFVDGLSDETEVSICDHLFRELPNDAAEFLHLKEYCVMLEIFEPENVFDARFSVHQEEDVLDAGDCSAVTVSNVVMEDVADPPVWAGNG